VATTAYREDFWTVCRAVVPFIGLLLIGLVVTSLWPALALFLVR
jgi:C4-dicarboxylate transporter DctM subunit